MEQTIDIDISGILRSEKEWEALIPTLPESFDKEKLSIYMDMKPAWMKYGFQAFLDIRVMMPEVLELVERIGVLWIGECSYLAIQSKNIKRCEEKYRRYVSKPIVDIETRISEFYRYHAVIHGAYKQLHFIDCTTP